MTSRIWFITGAGRGLGLEIARAALAQGDAVVATGRDAGKVEAAIGPNPDLHCVRLDVTSEAEARDAVASAVERFGRIDVLVNNAGNFFAGFFEELSSAQVRSQIETLLFGPMNVTRAALPVMRRQRAGLLLTAESTTYAAGSIDDYAARTAETVAAWTGMNGKQGGDPTRLAEALVQLARHDDPPGRFAAGTDAIQVFEAKANTLLAQAAAHRGLSSSLGFPDP